MEINPLEKSLIERFLVEVSGVITSSVEFSDVKVLDRSYTAIGFITEFAPCDALQLFSKGASKRYTNLGAELNSSTICTGYVFYIDDGLLTSLEGFTYGGESWPREVKDFEIFKDDLGSAHR